MGREVRRVPPDWQHPVKAEGNEFHAYEPMFVPLFDGTDFDRHEREAIKDGVFPPNPEWYMPTWSPEEATHFQMYETCSEGTPISPIFATPEELAHWLADTGASAFGESTASYEGWLRVAQGKPSIGGVLMPGSGFVSGVEFAVTHPSDDKEAESHE